MTKRLITAAAWILIIAVLLYLLLIGAVFVFQRKMEYPGAHRIGRAVEVAPAPWDGVQLDVAGGGPLTVWQVRPARLRAPTIVIFPGNDMGTLTMLPLGDALRQKGYGVILGAYRGYSGNSGSPTEAGLVADGRAALALAAADGPVVLYGHSLGSGVAADLAASDDQVSGLILSAPFTSASNIMSSRLPFLPIRRLMLDQFDILGKIPQIHCPVLIIHGDKDRVVPITESRKLADALGSRASVVVIEGGDHNSVWLDGVDAAERFVAQIDAASAPTPPAIPIPKHRPRRKHASH